MYLAVVDGRATGRAGMTCDELIALYQELGATDAVNLDGGGSSAMWLAGSGVVTYPSDGNERVVANHLAIRATGAGDAPNCPNPRWDASFVGMDAPVEMTSGDEAVVWMELANEGNITWSLDRTRIGTQDPQDRESAFYKAENWISPSRPSGPDHSTYGPGSVGRFTWVMVAPEVTESTVFVETFQPVQEGVTWFGPKQTFTILVHPRSGPTTPEPDAGPDDGSGANGDGLLGGCSIGARRGGGGAFLFAAAAAIGIAIVVIPIRTARRRRE
jgi:hypothetical protein